jgi:hypothetical protein
MSIVTTMLVVMFIGFSVQVLLRSRTTLACNEVLLYYRPSIWLNYTPKYTYGQLIWTWKAGSRLHRHLTHNIPMSIKYKVYNY